MKKTILTLAIALMSMGSLTMMAQTEKSEQVKSEQQCKNKDCSKKDKKSDRCKERKGKRGKDCVERSNKKGQLDRRGNFRADASGKKRGGFHKGGNPMLKGITLSEEQQQKVAKINDNMRADFEKVKKNERKEMSKLNDKRNKEILKVLTPEQQKVYKANEAKMAKRMERAGRDSINGKRMVRGYMKGKKLEGKRAKDAGFQEVKYEPSGATSIKSVAGETK